MWLAQATVPHWNQWEFSCRHHESNKKLQCLSHLFFIFLIHFLCKEGYWQRSPGAIYIKFTPHASCNWNFFSGQIILVQVALGKGISRTTGPRDSSCCIMAAGILPAATGIIFRLVGFSFDKKSFCDLMDPEITLQENYFYVDSDRYLKSPRLCRMNKNQQHTMPMSGEKYWGSIWKSNIFLLSCYATVPTQGVGHWDSLGHRTCWWHHNYEWWYLVSHNLSKHKLRSQLDTRSSWSAYLPTVTAPGSFQQDTCSLVVHLHVLWL